MKKKYQNIFFIFGFVVLLIMITQLDFQQVWNGLRHAGYWFIAVLLLWLFLYFINTSSWYIIIKSQKAKPEHERISFGWLYKITISGFALNYATPGGLMGGVPYRIMTLVPKIGTERASSSVILFAMTHVFCHFLFWFLSIFLFVFTQKVTLFMALLFLVIGAFCLLGIWFFMSGYRKGLANRVMNFIKHLPFIKKWAQRFVESHKEQLDTIDQQIASLHAQNPKTFFSAVLLELTSRVASALEVYFILLVIMPDINFLQCVMILAFTSLFANLLFFIPLQLGGREGGFLMATAGLGMTAGAGLFVALLVRLRELIWTGIGLLLIKLDKPKTKDS